MEFPTSLLLELSVPDHLGAAQNIQNFVFGQHDRWSLCSSHGDSQLLHEQNVEVVVLNKLLVRNSGPGSGSTKKISSSPQSNQSHI